MIEEVRVCKNNTPEDAVCRSGNQSAGVAGARMPEVLTDTALEVLQYASVQYSQYLRTDRTDDGQNEGYLSHKNPAVWRPYLLLIYLFIRVITEYLVIRSYSSYSQSSSLGRLPVSSGIGGTDSEHATSWIGTGPA